MLPLINQTINIYTRRGFAVHEIKGDNEFECIIPDLSPIHVNLVGANEHVPEVENSIKVLKERMRCLFNGLPFTCVPRLMVVEGLEFVTGSLNSIPAGDGISSSLSPATIFTGARPPNLATFKLSFGDYVELHVDHQPYNSMKPRTVPCIALRPAGNTQGSYYFLDLHSGRRCIG